jgi:hypothetical protein
MVTRVSARIRIVMNPTAIEQGFTTFFMLKKFVEQSWKVAGWSRLGQPFEQPLGPDFGRPPGEPGL